MTQAYLNMGYSQNQLGQYREALASSEQVIRLHKNSDELGPAYYIMGFAYDKMGQRTKALEAYRKSITHFKQLSFQSADTYFYLGNAYLQMGQYQEAIVSFKQAIKIRPRFAQPHLSLGVAYHATGNRQAALEEYSILKTIDPSRAERLNRALNTKR
jgi:tetratricopeptide (TPR) repeat protein